MSFNLNSRIVDLVAPAARTDRRSFLIASAGSLLLPALAHAEPVLPGQLRRWGSGEYRRFGFLVYEATLWAGDDPQRPPLALRLDYRRSIKGQAIAEASVREMRPFVGDEARLAEWGREMARIFPDVESGDHLLGIHQAGSARFYQGDKLLGGIDAPGFADAFFAIWLDPRTSAPKLRDALLRRG